MCCTRLAGNTGGKNDAKNRHLGTIAQLCWAVSSQLRHVSTIGKKLVKHTSSTCPRNMVNFRPLTAEIGLGVWGTPANFNGFRIFAALHHGTLVLGVSHQPNFAALNRGRHLYSARRPSRWALANISSSYCFSPFTHNWNYTNLIQEAQLSQSNCQLLHKCTKNRILKGLY